MIANVNGVAVELTEEEIASFILSQTPTGEDARLKRNRLLAETDVWGLSDYPTTAEQAAYRQALRDITDQSGFPENITWPTKPEATK